VDPTNEHLERACFKPAAFSCLAARAAAGTRYSSFDSNFRLITAGLHVTDKFFSWPLIVAPDLTKSLFNCPNSTLHCYCSSKQSVILAMTLAMTLVMMLVMTLVMTLVMALVMTIVMTLVMMLVVLDFVCHSSRSLVV